MAKRCLAFGLMLPPMVAFSQQQRSGAGDNAGLSEVVASSYGDGDEQATIAEWSATPDDDPSKFWAALLMLDRSPMPAHRQLDDVAGYVRAATVPREVVFDALTRLQSHDMSESARNGYAMILLLLPPDLLAQYVRGWNRSTLAMSNPLRSAMLLEQVAASSPDKEVPPWLQPHLKRLAALGGRAALPYVSYGPVDDELVDRLISVANDDEVTESQLKILKRVRRQLLTEHRVMLDQAITRDSAKQILLQ